MEWISVKDQLPKHGIIVAIMMARKERSNDPIRHAKIVILRSEWEGDEWRTMDCTERYYLPNDENCDNEYKDIKYWIPWNEFQFPESMIIKESK